MGMSGWVQLKKYNRASSMIPLIGKQRMGSKDAQIL